MKSFHGPDFVDCGNGFSAGKELAVFFFICQYYGSLFNPLVTDPLYLACMAKILI